MKKLLLVVACVALVGLAPCAFAAQVDVSGTMQTAAHVYSDQAKFFSHSSAALDDTKDQLVYLKYRLETSIATDDNAIKGIFGIEVGGSTARFGDANLKYSGDSRDAIELMHAYTDFMLGPGRLKIGLQPWNINPYVWKENAAGILWDASAGNIDYSVSWSRGEEHKNTSNNDAWDESEDALAARVNFGIGEGSKAGVFAMYQTANPSATTPADINSNDWYYKDFGDFDANLWTVGVDGKLQTSGPLFVNWDVMYQNGKIENVAFTDSLSGTANTTYNDFDVNAYFAHVDVGVKLGKLTLTYTGWYASGDDDATDDEFNAFLSTDVDMSVGYIFFEGQYTGDVYYTDRPYLFDKGMFLNRLGADFKVTDKTTVGGGVIYLQTAEDMKYTDTNGVARSSSDLGIELDAEVTYQMYKNLQLGLEAGYLISGDAMDYFEVGTAKNGSADENIFLCAANILYKF